MKILITIVLIFLSMIMLFKAIDILKDIKW